MPAPRLLEAMMTCVAVVLREFRPAILLVLGPVRKHLQGSPRRQDLAEDPRPFLQVWGIFFLPAKAPVRGHGHQVGGVFETHPWMASSEKVVIYLLLPRHANVAVKALLDSTFQVLGRDESQFLLVRPV